MGNHYVNYTLRGPATDAVAAVLGRRRAAIATAADGCVVVFDEPSDRQDTSVITQLSARLSGELACAVLAVLNHDDDVLWHQLHDRGRLIDEYDSTPGYFDAAAEPSSPKGGDAAKLCRAFGSDAVSAVDGVLRRSIFCSDEQDVFAFERHADLVRSLGLPDFAVGLSYAGIRSGELPDGLSQDEILMLPRRSQR
jgi:hypothetical protein